jgi:hypothetical protein
MPKTNIPMANENTANKIELTMAALSFVLQYGHMIAFGVRRDLNGASL